MPCKHGSRGGIEEARIQHQREKNTPQRVQDNFTGFIVEVKIKNQHAVSYRYDGETKLLELNETYVGYFWQMTGAQDDGTFKKAHVHETLLIDADKKLFLYGGEAVFSVDDVVITIRALRGPTSNNRYLPKKYEKYETWNSA